MRERARKQVCLFFKTRFRFTRNIIIKIITNFLYKIINYYFCVIVRGRLWSMNYAVMQIFFIDAACTYKAIFLFTALFRSMTYFRKSIKSRLVLSGTWSTNIPLWETSLNDSHVGSTTAHREVVLRYHCLTSCYVEQRIRKAFAQSIPSCF